MKISFALEATARPVVGRFRRLKDSRLVFFLLLARIYKVRAYIESQGEPNLSHQRGEPLVTQRSKREGATRTERVLLIGGHALFRQGLALLLRWHFGLESVEAGSLAEGRRVLTDLKGMTALAIIALDLPDGDGSELIEQLHNTKPDVPVLALTANQSLIQSVRAQEAGADTVLALKVPVEQIISTVEQILRS